MSETWAGNNFIRFYQLNTAVIMETNTINEMPYRVLGQWSAQDADTAEQKQGSINFGFETQEKALAYMANLCSIAMRNDFYVRTEFAKLDVSADKWSNMRNFQGSYRVAQYIN